MPAPLDVNREAVRVLAIAVGVREAARQLNLPESTVKSWSTRDEWLAPTILPPTITPKMPASGASISPANALEEHMQELGGKTRLGLARGLANGAEHVAQLDGASVLAQAGEVASLTKSAASVHGWNDGGGSQKVRVNVFAGTGAVVEISDPGAGATDAV